VESGERPHPYAFGIVLPPPSKNRRGKSEEEKKNLIAEDINYAMEKKNPANNC